MYPRLICIDFCSNGVFLPECAHPEWPLHESVRHLKKTMRLTSAEMAKLAGVSTKTIQDIEQGRSDGTVQTMNRIFGMLGLKLGVVRRAPQ
ncbi:helix-turn-helix domain-containing protein [Burkholderia anthina]|uniref:helix-turn-helix domain-containing protein n=1 Tax=Burkholderia anthina TaxID=179879 RepID=UPI0037C0E6E4